MKGISISGIPNPSTLVIKENSMKALEKAIEICGGHDKFIRKLNIYHQLLAAWKRARYGVDARYVIAIERLTEGKVDRSELRMDIFPKD